MPANSDSMLSLSPVFEILHEPALRRMEGLGRVFKLLPFDQDSPIARILFEEGSGSECSRIEALWDGVAAIVKDRQVQRSITDWPFMHFWENPYEPRHSKLLGYFINPDEAHKCGAFLLGKLLGILKESKRIHSEDHEFPIKNCKVHVESGHIDLLIERDEGDGKYALIIENKINGAKDQPRQLEGYVEKKLAGFNPFKPEQIHVLYLPLRSDKNPQKSDVDAIEGKGVSYNKITFEDEILPWLNSVLDEKDRREWPQKMNEGMAENLIHYRSLIRFLITKNKDESMNEQIREKLKQAAERDPLPSWEQVKLAAQSSRALQICFEAMLRGKLLLRIQAILKSQGVSAAFYWTQGKTAEPCEIVSEYDPRFEGEASICVRVNEYILVSVGAYSGESPTDIFWAGYLRSGSAEKQEEFEAIVGEEAKKRLREKYIGTNKPWYAWEYERQVTYLNCGEEETATRLATKLLEMRTGMDAACA